MINIKFIINSSLFEKQIERASVKIAFDSSKETRPSESMEQDSMKLMESIASMGNSSSESVGQNSIKTMESTSSEDMNLPRELGRCTEATSDFAVRKRSSWALGLKMEEWCMDYTTEIVPYPIKQRYIVLKNIQNDSLNIFGQPQKLWTPEDDPAAALRNARMYLNDWCNLYFDGKDNIDWTETVSGPHWETTLAECAYADFHIAINNEISRLGNLIRYNEPHVEEGGDAYPGTLCFKRWYDDNDLRIIYDGLMNKGMLLGNPSFEDFVYVHTGGGNPPKKRLKWKQKNVCRYYVQQFLNSNWEVAEKCFMFKGKEIKDLAHANNISKKNKKIIDNILLQIGIHSPAKESR